mmetsp:Transcript_24988/g.68925  ORF Transcript_24988/g.68925 Transcript_24988/m.68925 type:complete len:106 (+) Transcript_24988:310-627(+)|eukprot:CAMPEP_0172363252 /NCGR_PEP_ID=MMETSP1060-20121228/6664_1 /TAXON_ID=37318 /ORGANISM="Pseudo-nitzschia pungens, Strain cf. cingulata" /LENGTH=105 /DNA_ID=CAMNT_0013085961 /DNA_START=296 /DNA_END=613 /DNA_ORIENTATION=+
MTSVRFASALLLSAIAFLASGSVAFAPVSQVSGKTVARSSTHLMGVFDGEQERKALTRDSEPEEFFATNTDKMSDEEKIPIALAGLAGISLPFIFGLIALYAAQG